MSLPFDPIAEARRNWLAHNWGGTDAMAAATSIARAQQIMVARIDEALASLGLSFSRFEALALLFFSRHGSLPMGKIGVRLQVHASSVTSTIDRLEKDGLVRRQSHPTDRRTVLAEITPAGRKAAEAGAAALEAVGFGLGGLGPEDLARLDDTIRTLRRSAGDFE